MSIVQVSSLSAAERLLLGNNLDAATRSFTVSRNRRNRRIIRAVNRSLARFGDSVGRLDRRLLTATSLAVFVGGVRIK